MTTTLTQENLALKFKRIETMKWLIDLEKSNEEFTEQYLQEQLNQSAFRNFPHLIMFYHYILKMPECVKQSAEQVIFNRNNATLCKKYYRQYLRNFKTNKKFIDYDYMIIFNRIDEALKDIPQKKKSDVNYTKRLLLEVKRIQLILLFNILAFNDFNHLLFRKADFLCNLPALLYWIDETQKKPIKELNNDDCEVIAGFIYGFNIEEMLVKLNLSSFALNPDALNEIIEKLPAKFSVQNITQVLFRVVLLKPALWQLSEHVDIVKHIKEINNVL